MSHHLLTIEDRMINHVEGAVKQFKKVPYSIISGKAEEYAEVFVSSEVGLQNDDPRKESAKQEYIARFIEEIKQSL